MTISKVATSALLLLLQASDTATAFTAVQLPSCSHTISSTLRLQPLNAASGKSSSFDSSLFDLFDGEEEEMFPIAENYVHAKYKQYATLNNKEVCSQDDIATLLKSLLPPVTSNELDSEVTKTLGAIMENPENSAATINEDCFVKAIVQNSYWRNAGSLVVKELMFFDALYSYYQTGESLLQNDDYEELKENLTWEGSSVASMNRNECMFVNAVAASKRGEPILDDAEYKALKTDLKGENSWVVSRGEDALEKLGLDTFIGYLHRALA